MSRVMFQFRQLQPGTPTLVEVCTMFDLTPDEVDPEFGVIETDSVDHLYTILVDEAAQPRIDAALRSQKRGVDPATGIFSNPRQEAFGDPD